MAHDQHEQMKKNNTLMMQMDTTRRRNKEFSENPFAKKMKDTNDAKARTRALASHVVKASTMPSDKRK